MILSHLYQQLFRSPEPGEAGGGAAPTAEADQPTSTDTADAGGEPGASTPQGGSDDPEANLMAFMGEIGKPEGKADVEGAAATEGGKPAGTEVAQPQPGTADDLTPPEGLSERARERFTQMAERVKSIPEIEQRAKVAEERLQDVRKMVNETGLHAQEFTEMLDMAKGFRSNNPQEMQRAMAYLDTLRTDLAQRLGVEVPGVDVLATHPDLKADVDAMVITRERALEIAKLREQGKRSEAATQQQQREQQIVATVQGAAEAAKSAMEKLAGTPGHEYRTQKIGAYFRDPAKVQAFVTTYEPHQWEAALMLMYESIPPQAVASAGPQPLRPSAARAGRVPQHAGPVTPEMAVNNAFASIGL